MKPLVFALILLALPATALAQFTGPAAERERLTVEEASHARVGTYASVTGQIVNRLREDYYTFRDETGEIRVEIPSHVWSGRAVSPQTTVRLYVEVDANLLGRRYLWTESLEVVGS
jgi:uncharacterized protein (TIGR00156 family)